MSRASASPMLFDVPVWCSHATGERRMCLLFAALAALHRSLEERLSKHSKVGPFLVLHLTPPQIAVPRWWMAFFPPFPFIGPPKTLLSKVLKALPSLCCHLAKTSHLKQTNICFCSFSLCPKATLTHTDPYVMFFVSLKGYLIMSAW